MKKPGLIIAAIVILLLLAVGGMFLLKSSKIPVANKTTNTQTAKPQTGNSITGSIMSLLSGGKNVNCQVTYPDNKGTGSVYVSDKKFAGDFTTKDANGKETTGNMVSDGTYMYVWSSAMPTGIKINLTDANKAAQNAQASQGISNINEKVNLNCNPWAPEASKFTVPSNIKFQDMSQLLQQFQPQGTGTVAPKTQTGSSPCDQITDPTTKAACVKALQGNGQ